VDPAFRASRGAALQGKSFLQQSGGNGIGLALAGIPAARRSHRETQ